VSLMMALEDEFKGSVSEEEERRIHTVGEVIDCIRNMATQGQPR
jgi:acyl carrier protein